MPEPPLGISMWKRKRREISFKHEKKFSGKREKKGARKHLVVRFWVLNNQTFFGHWYKVL